MRCAGDGMPHQLEHLDRARSCAARGDIAVWAQDRLDDLLADRCGPD